MFPLPQDRHCIFCGRSHSLHEVMGRYVCSSCWEIIAIIALNAIGPALEEGIQIRIRKIEEDE